MIIANNEERYCFIDCGRENCSCKTRKISINNFNELLNNYCDKNGIELKINENPTQEKIDYIKNRILLNKLKELRTQNKISPEAYNELIKII